MINLTEIHSLTDFQRHAKEHIQRLKQTGDPAVLTVNGKAELVVQDAAGYQKLLDALERAETIAAIEKGVEDIEAGRTRPAKKFLAEAREQHGLDAATESNCRRG